MMILLLLTLGCLAATAGALFAHAASPKASTQDDPVPVHSWAAGDTSYLKWVPLKDKRVPDNAVGIFNTYTSRQDFVCRARDYCTFGFLNEGRGLLCFFPFRGYELQTENFDVLVNIDNFERLEWKPGATVANPGISFCQENYVGKNEYGLGDIFKGYFYLPWQGKEIWYSSYDVLSVNRDVFNVQFSNVTYDLDRVNRTRHAPYAIKTSRVENKDSQEVVVTVHLEDSTVIANSWQSSFSSSLTQSTTIAAGVPDILSVAISIGAVQTMTLTDGHLESETVTQAEDVQVKVPPGYFCVVVMEGRKVEADIPYRGIVTKVYKDETRRSTAITGTYSGALTGEINSRVERCAPLPTAKPAPTTKPASGQRGQQGAKLVFVQRGRQRVSNYAKSITASSGAGQLAAVLTVLFCLVLFFSLMVFGVPCSCRPTGFKLQRFRGYSPLGEDLIPSASAAVGQLPL